MWKRLLSLVILISFLSFSSCFAFDIDSIKDQCIPKINEWWGKSLNWIGNDFKPWIEKNLGEGARKEFEREFNEAIKDVPIALQNIWNNIKGIFNQ